MDIVSGTPTSANDAGTVVGIGRTPSSGDGWVPLRERFDVCRVGAIGEDVLCDSLRARFTSGSELCPECSPGNWRERLEAGNGDGGDVERGRFAF